jgi:hypothetical protein
MVMLCESANGRTYQLCDDRGRPIGRIVEPRGAEFVGPQAGTVLLVREPLRIRPHSTPPLHHQER